MENMLNVDKYQDYDTSYDRFGDLHRGSFYHTNQYSISHIDI